MILAAGLGTRIQPLSALLPKPAMPVRGVPLVGYHLALLAAHGVREVVLNLHHLPERLVEAVQDLAPPGLEIRFSQEPALLGTGGGIRAAAAFLRESDPCLLLGGDMLLDTDLSALVRLHQERGDAVTFLLCNDGRADEFGTIGLADGGRVVRIGRRYDQGGETEAGVYAHATVISRRALGTLPHRAAFGHLDDWVAPLLAAGARDVRGVVKAREHCLWEPMGTLQEYLAVNLRRTRLSYLDAEALARRRGASFSEDLILGAGAVLGPGARLVRAVVWDGEAVPAGMHASDGVFAGGCFHACGPIGGGVR